MRLVLANSLGPDNDELVSALEGFLCHDAAGAVWIGQGHWRPDEAASSASAPCALQRIPSFS